MANTPDDTPSSRRRAETPLDGLDTKLPDFKPMPAVAVKPAKVFKPMPVIAPPPQRGVAQYRYFPHSQPLYIIPRSSTNNQDWRAMRVVRPGEMVRYYRPCVPGGILDLANWKSRFTKARQRYFDDYRQVIEMHVWFDFVDYLCIDPIGTPVDVVHDPLLMGLKLRALKTTCTKRTKSAKGVYVPHYRFDGL